MNRILRPLALVAGLAIGSSAHAGIPVIDNVAIAKAVQQVAAWGKQYEQMAAQIQEAQKQLQQLETTYQSMTGSRGLGSLLANPGLPQFLPDEWKTVYETAAGGGYAGISGSLSQIVADEELAGSVADVEQQIMKRSRETAATDKAAGLRAYDGAKARLVQIEALVSEINATSDPKAIAELQARIQAEQAAISNEATKLQMIAMLQQAEHRLIEEQRAQLNRRIMSGANTGFPSLRSGTP
jgi:type IV secretion system protein VirB5